MPSFLSLITMTLLGLIVGSFLNVVITRLPKMLMQKWQLECQTFLALPLDSRKNSFNFWTPASHCPLCQHSLRWFQNIPLISFIMLRGRCAYCHQKISLRYFLVELFSMLLAGMIAFHFEKPLMMGAAFALTTLLLVLTFIDMEHQILPDSLTLPLLWLGLLVNTQELFTDLTSAVLGAAAGYLFLRLVAIIFTKITGKLGMGQGDFKCLAALGAWFGWQALPLILFIAAATGSLIGLLGLILKKQKRQSPLPFGPYLALGGIIVLLFIPSTLSFIF